MNLFKKTFSLFEENEKSKAKTLIALIFMVAIFEMIGVASIMPFMAVLANPEIINQNEILKYMFDIAMNLGVESLTQFQFFLGVLLFCVLMLSVLIKSIAIYMQTRFCLLQEYFISKRLLEGYLKKEFSWFLNKNSAELGKTILSEVNQVIVLSVVPLMNIIAQGAIVIAVLILLIIVDPYLAFFSGITLIILYTSIFKTINKKLSTIGESRLLENEKRFIAVNEAFGAIKEIKLANLEEIYIERYSSPAKKYAENISTATIIGHLPRFALEAVAFGGMLLIILYLMSSGEGFSDVLPILSLYALAGYRLMPCLQQLYSSYTQLKFSDAALNVILKDLSDISDITYEHDKNDCGKNDIIFNKMIELKDICFKYPNSKKNALENINLTIDAKSTVGFVGATGGGKTTIIDLMLGLFEPSKGFVEIDGLRISKTNKKHWQKNIGYVPQSIYLSDDSVMANIAFGIEKKYIDKDKVIKSAKMANLHDFITNNLEYGYETFVGERGVRLSGGQRQRIGIARALYNEPKILILDEATSALDNVTEKNVMDAVNELSTKITIIIIAHRLTTVEKCDNIFMMENGRIIGSGTYNFLVENCEKFKILTLSN